MRVMGIDPGSLITGYGVIEENKGEIKTIAWGAIRSKAKQAFPLRLKTIYEGLIQTIETHEPDNVAVEDIFFSKNANSALKLGQTRGVALIAALNKNLPVHEYTALAVKQSISGYGRADKNQVRTILTQLLNLNPQPEPLDASDALAIALCHIHSYPMKERLEQANQQ